MIKFNEIYKLSDLSYRKSVSPMVRNRFKFEIMEEKEMRKNDTPKKIPTDYFDLFFFIVEVLLQKFGNWLYNKSHKYFSGESITKSLLLKGKNKKEIKMALIWNYKIARKLTKKITLLWGDIKKIFKRSIFYSIGILLYIKVFMQHIILQFKNILALRI